MRRDVGRVQRRRLQPARHNHVGNTRAKMRLFIQFLFQLREPGCMPGCVPLHASLHKLFPCLL